MYLCIAMLQWPVVRDTWWVLREEGVERRGYSEKRVLREEGVESWRVYGVKRWRVNSVERMNGLRRLSEKTY